MKRFIFGMTLILLLTAQGCSPALPAPTATALPPSSSATLSPTPTDTPTPQATSTPTLTPTSTPGPDINLLYLSENQLKSYRLQTWTEETISIESLGRIDRAALSPDHNWLAIADDRGVKILEKPPFIQTLENQSIYVGNWGFIFNNDSSMLAYSDNEGLQIHNLRNNTSFELLTHSFNFEYLSQYRSFSPQQWSPDDQWLWISVMHWEGISYFLAHMPTRKMHHFNGCYSNIAWLPDSQSFLAAVRFSAIHGCGEEDGIYFVTLNKDSTYTEKRIYEDTLAEPWTRESTTLSLSPDNKLIGFAQIHFPYSDGYSRLILSNLDGSDKKELDNVDGRIASLLWSEDGKNIIYVVQNAGISTIKRVNINSGEISELCFLPEHVIIPFRPNGNNWLPAFHDEDIYLYDKNIYGYDQAEFGIYLINEINGDVIKISGQEEMVILQPTPTSTPRAPKIPE